VTARHWGILAFTSALWGASYLFIKVGLDGGIPEGWIIFGRSIMACAILVPLALRAGALPALRARPGWVLALGLAQVVLPFGLITFGENHVPSALTGILVASSPLFIALLAPRVDPAERSQGWALVGVLLGLVGVGLLFGLDLSGDVETLLGGAMIVGAALSYACAVLIVKRGFTGVPAVGVAASTMVVGAVAWLPVAALTVPADTPDTNAVLSLVALGLGGTGVGMWLFYLLIAEIGPARAAVIAYVAPAFAVVYGMVFLDEALTAGTVGGLVLILAGSRLAASRRAPPGDGEALVSRSGPSRSTSPAPARAR
jgi:drug/metabolite transporter (DMT)-like permease